MRDSNVFLVRSSFLPTTFRFIFNRFLTNLPQTRTPQNVPPSTQPQAVKELFHARPAIVQLKREMSILITIEVTHFLIHSFFLMAGKTSLHVAFVHCYLLCFCYCKDFPILLSRLTRNTLLQIRKRSNLNLTEPPFS